MTCIVPARTSADLDAARVLITEYVDSLPVDVSYEHVPEECAALPGAYAPPGGELLLAIVDGRPAGCIALRPLDRETCEMKRVYLRPLHRGAGIGRALAAAIVDAARRIGYRRMRLDTLSSMSAAVSLYASMGFRPIPPYRSIPAEGAVFMELDLSA